MKRIPSLFRACLLMLLAAALLLSLTGCGKKAEPAPVEDKQEQTTTESAAETEPPEELPQTEDTTVTEPAAEEPTREAEPAQEEQPAEETEHAGEGIPAGQEPAAAETATPAEEAKPEEEKPAAEPKPTYAVTIEPGKQAEPKPDTYTRLSGGSFGSDTGTKLNLTVDWAVYQTGEGPKLCLDVYLQSYSLLVGPRGNGVVLNIDGTDYIYRTEAIDYEGAEYTSFLLGSYELDMGEDPAELDVCWNFLGSYGGQELPQIHAVGTVE